VRADKWLWQARFFKSRSKASDMVGGGHLRVNGAKVVKPAQPVSPGDTLVFPQGRTVRVVRVVALASRRGPASEAAALYEDMTPPDEVTAPRVGPRPTKKVRRDAGFSKDGPLE